MPEKKKKYNAITTGAAANRASVSKTAKYGALSVLYIFVPVAIETAGTWGQSAIELVHEIGKRISTVIEDTRATTFLFHNFQACGFVPVGPKIIINNNN